MNGEAELTMKVALIMTIELGMEYIHVQMDIGMKAIGYQI